MNPIKLFIEHFEVAKKHPNVPDASQFFLATTSKDGIPSVRCLLLKSCDDSGFVFFTNKNSQKGRDISHNSNVQMCFYWAPLGMQIRISGKALPVSYQESDVYFLSRPKESQIAAITSKQSEKITSYEDLLSEYQDNLQTNTDPQRPTHWCGFKIVPSEIEFCEDRPHRLHKRILYTKMKDSWNTNFLYP